MLIGLHGATEPILRVSNTSVPYLEKCGDRADVAFNYPIGDVTCTDVLRVVDVSESSATYFLASLGLDAHAQCRIAGWNSRALPMQQCRMYCVAHRRDQSEMRGSPFGNSTCSHCSRVQFRRRQCVLSLHTIPLK